MTCIVGVCDGNTVHFGADSAGVDGWHALMIRSDSKVFIIGEFIFGFTTSFRMGQLLRYHFTPPEIPENANNLMAYMVTEFSRQVRAVFNAGGFATVKDSVETGGEFLVGIRGRLFRICQDYQVAESVEGFDAIGSGGHFALGALHATAGKPAPARIEAALEAAQALCSTVRGPFLHLSKAYEVPSAHPLK